LGFALFVSLLETKNRVTLIICFGVIIGLSYPLSGIAEEEATKPKPLQVTPMPPVRPSHWPLATPKNIAPPPVPEPEPSSTIYPDHGPSLPAASRARMHQCGVEWQSMKASGAAADQTWRAFAQACLVR
jgi:hypothetical protein